jgi:hypothetical protein
MHAFCVSANSLLLYLMLTHATIDKQTYTYSLALTSQTIEVKQMTSTSASYNYNTNNSPFCMKTVAR